jgi:aminoglycoside phosphotransferase (APT) family kinase protein
MDMAMSRMTRLLNTTAPIRAGEELDAARLSQYLRTLFPDLNDALAIEQYPSGHSNLTYLVRAGARDFVLRRPPFGSTVKSAHDMSREFRVLSGLHRVYAQVPRPIAYCEDQGILGAPFYLMERIDGVVLRKQLPGGVIIPEETAQRLSRSFIENLAAIHGLNLEDAGLTGFGKPQGYVRRQIEGWTRRYHDAATENLREMDQLAGWLDRQQPPESGVALIHNDYKLDNVVLDAADLTRIIGVFDWEMATIGDPLMDLGSTLAYWIEKNDSPELRALQFAPTTSAGFVSRHDLTVMYEQASGRAVSNPVFYYVYGLFKLVVIIQQIYYRYVKGFTRDERFAGFGDTVRVLARRATDAVQTGRF